MGRIIEIRAYRLKPGSRPEYDRLFRLALLEAYTDAVIEVDEATIEGLRACGAVGDGAAG